MRPLALVPLAAVALAGCGAEETIKDATGVSQVEREIKRATKGLDVRSVDCPTDKISVDWEGQALNVRCTLTLKGGGKRTVRVTKPANGSVRVVQE